MNATLEHIRNEAKALSSSEREMLLIALDYDLRGSDIQEDDSDEEIEAAWEQEIQRRIDEVESGKVKLLSEEEFLSVFEEARSELRHATTA